MLNLEQRLSRIQTQLQKFHVVGGEGATVSGGIGFGGYAVETRRCDGGGSTPVVLGCTDPEANNFDPDATEDDGSCTYDILGCTDPEADNYDPDANIDDGSCTYSGACCNFSCYIASEDDCVDSGGEYQGDGSTCDPDPCPGACCLPTDNDCVSETAEDCASDGGFFQGVGSSCDDGCGCTDPAACNYNPLAAFSTDTCSYPPTADVGCDIAYASGSKCGFVLDDRYYRKKIHEFSYSVSASCDPDSAGGGGDFFETVEYDSTCSTLSVTDRSGSGSCSSHASPTPTFGDCFSSTTLIPGSCGFGSFYGFYNSDLFCSYTYSGSAGSGVICPNGCCCGCGCCGNPGVVTQAQNDSYDSEYTTGELISNVEDMIPGFTGEFGGGACCSSRALADDESTYSEQIAQYRFTFSASTDDFEVDWIERFTPAGGGGSVDTPRSDFFSGGTATSGTYSLAAPSTNGTTCIVEVTVICA